MKKVMFISSEGGHLSELQQGHLSELQQLDFKKYDYQIVTEKTRTTQALKEKYRDKIHYLIYGTRRTPIIYFFILLFNSIISLFLFLKYRPDYIVSTGTHTAVLYSKDFQKKNYLDRNICKSHNRNIGRKNGI